jgi:radical SAM superfamily enzyme YgiQ (UPF0313 family)
MSKLKNILAENMRRFGTKNLNEDLDQNNNGYPDETEKEKTYFPKGEFKSTENFEDFLKEIDAMPKESVKQIMGKHHYIPTPGTYQQQAKNYDNDIKLYMEDNIGKTDLYQLEEYWKFYISDEYRKK